MAAAKLPRFRSGEAIPHPDWGWTFVRSYADYLNDRELLCCDYEDGSTVASDISIQLFNGRPRDDEILSDLLRSMFLKKSCANSGVIWWP